MDLNRWLNQLWQLDPLKFSPWEWGFVIVGLSLSIWLIFWLRSYYREDTDDTDESLEMLTQFRNLHQEGGLSDDEFRLIRSHLTKSAHKVLAAEPTDTTVVSAGVERQKSKDSAKSPEPSVTVEDTESDDDRKSEG